MAVERQSNPATAPPRNSPSAQRPLYPPPSPLRKCRASPASATSVMVAKSQPFEFISVSGTNVKGDAATRKRVRSRAQADYRRKNPPPPKPLKASFDIGEWMQVVSRDAQSVRPNLYAQRIAQMCETPSSDGTVSRSPSPFERSGSDVFQLMTPIERKRAQMLWQHRKLYKYHA